MNRRASLFDSFWIVSALLAFVVAAVAVGLVFEAFNSAVQAGDFPDVAKTSVSGFDTALPGVFDWLFVALLFGLPLVSMGLAWFNNIPLVFFYVVLAVLLLMVFIGWGLQSGWESIIAGGSTFALYVTTRMPLTSFVMNNFGFYSLVVVAVIAFGTYVKHGQGGVSSGL